MESRVIVVGESWCDRAGSGLRDAGPVHRSGLVREQRISVRFELNEEGRSALERVGSHCRRAPDRGGVA